MANDISKIDKALAVDGTVREDGLVWYPAYSEFFSLTGLYKEALGYDKPRYIRMPEEVAKAVNSGVAGLYANTAGGKLRFATTSAKIAIRVAWKQRTAFSHMPMAGTGGFDMYVTKDGESRYVHTFIPPCDASGSEGYESEFKFGNAELKNIQLNFPLYNRVDELYIGLEEGAEILPYAYPYAYEKPILYYGSSITQGGCASKPSSSYQAMLSRWLNVDHINMGFSGSARGEQVIAEYIAGLPMEIFVLDYDYNAPTEEHLEATHYPFYKTVREKNPTLPIICVSAHGSCSRGRNPRCREIIRATVERARAEGDENVYFVDGGKFFPEDAQENCTVDGTHPNDLGFYFMAKGLLPIIKEILNSK